MPSVACDQYDQRLVAQDAAITSAPVDEDENALQLEEPASVTVSDGGGLPIGTPIAATLSADLSSLTATIPAASLALFDHFTLAWSALVGGVAVSWTSRLETVGDFYFTFANFRAQGREFASAEVSDIRRWRHSVEQFIEQRCKVSFVPRGYREIVKGNGRKSLGLSRRPVRAVYTISVTDDGVTSAWTADQLASLQPEDVANGVLRLPAWWTGAWPTGQLQPGIWKPDTSIAVHYAYGEDAPSGRMRRAAAYLARLEAIIDERVPPSAVLQATEYGNFRMATPGPDSPTGIPWIDELLDREGHSVPSVG